MDSFVVPLLPTAQSAMSVVSTNARSLSLESIPLVDTTPLLRANEQANNSTSNSLSSSSKHKEQTDINISSTSTESSLSDPERKESELTIQVSHKNYISRLYRTSNVLFL